MLVRWNVIAPILCRSIPIYEYSLKHWVRSKFQTFIQDNAANLTATSRTDLLTILASNLGTSVAIKAVISENAVLVLHDSYGLNYCQLYYHNDHFQCHQTMDGPSSNSCMPKSYNTTVWRVLKWTLKIWSYLDFFLNCDSLHFRTLYSYGGT